MSSALAARAETVPDNLELYTLRDDLVRSYAPANAQELMLVTHIARSWLRLQRAQSAEERFFAASDMVQVVTSNLEQFKAITRHTSDCERAWRHALVNLEKTQRRRQRTDTASPRRAADPNFRPTPAPPIPEPPAPQATAAQPRPSPPHPAATLPAPPTERRISYAIKSGSPHAT